MSVTRIEDGLTVTRSDEDDAAIYGLPPAPTPATFADISDRQCFQQLANLGKITQDEALAAVKTGALPEVVTDGIAQLPADKQFPAQMLLCGATTFHRAHPMTPLFLSFFGMSEADGDALWAAAILL